MALNSYDNLKISIADWLARKDLDKHIPDFITMAEATLNNNRDFRIDDMVCKLTATVSGTEIAIPADYLGMRYLRIDGGAPLKQVSPEVMQGYKADGCTSSARVSYVHLGRRIEVYPEISEAEMSLFYYQKIPALSDTNQNNWLLARDPNIYIFGALLEATQFMKNDERVQLWMQRYAGSVDNLVASDKRDRWSGPMEVSL